MWKSDKLIVRPRSALLMASDLTHALPLVSPHILMSFTVPVYVHWWYMARSQSRAHTTRRIPARVLAMPVIFLTCMAHVLSLSFNTLFYLL